MKLIDILSALELTTTSIKRYVDKEVEDVRLDASDSILSPKILNIDFSTWDDGKFSLSYIDGSTSYYTVEFSNATGSPLSISDKDGNTTTINW